MVWFCHRVSLVVVMLVDVVWSVSIPVVKLWINDTGSECQLPEIFSQAKSLDASFSTLLGVFPVWDHYI